MPDPAITEYRNDGVAMNALAMLNNRMTGLGQQGRDKYLEHTIALDFTPLTRPDLQALYRKSKICEKVVDLLPKAATSGNWLEITVGKGRKGIPVKAVQYSEDLKLRTAVREAAIMGRLDGDGFVIVGVDDGGEPWEPVNEGRIRKLSWVYPVDRWRILPETATGRPGNPEFYSLYLPFTESLPDQRLTGKIHRSRVLRFPGKKLWGDMITRNTGYNDSVLQTFFQSFVKYLIAIEYSTRMVQDYNVFTYKLQGLAKLILAGDQEKIFHRFQAILMSMSSLGGLAMDADQEDAQFISRNFSGLDALIDRLKDDTSAAAAMPPTQLWGSSQKSALSNSSEGDKFAWADCVADYRSEIFDEPISDFFRLVMLAQNGPTGGRLPESWNVSFKSVLRLNLKEQTALRKDQTMGVDVPSVQAGILLKQEVRESAWSGSEYTIERQLQPDLWAKQQAEAEQQAEGGEQEAAGDSEPEDEPADPTAPSLEPRMDDATPAKRIIDWHGLKLGLQYQPFDIRHGKVLPVAYGHIQKTRGADGMACDCYVGSDLESDQVFEITQLVNGQFDEHKYMLGFASLDAARETFLKVMPAAMFGGIREVGLAGLEPYRLDGGSEGTNPKAPVGGTNRTDADNPILSIIDRADKHLQGLEETAIERVNSALESSYKALEAQILRSYSLETPGALMGRERATVLLSQVADLLGLLNTRNAEDIQEAFEDLLRGADSQGTTLADDLTRAIANQSLQMSANVPTAAIVNQATEGMTRLRNHTEAFADKASTIVSQGLIQGWGPDKVASLLRQELGVVQHKAETIARTESLSASNGASVAHYQRNGIELFTWYATADDRLCPTCGARNQKVYRLVDCVMPAHPRCRCYPAPASQTWLDLGLIDTAWATKFREQGLTELAALGLEPDYGRSAFEKANGLEAPEPVWSPGERSDSFECDEWREDAGIPCGGSWIKAGHRCTKGISSHHPSANPNHAGHTAYQGALAATSGKHTHPAANPSHPDHAAYKSGFDTHGGTAPLPSGGSGGGSAGGGSAPTPATPAKKAAAKRSSKKAAASSAATTTPSATPAQPASPVRLNQAELTTKRADLEKRFGKKLVQDAESNVKKVLSNADVFVRVGSTDTLEKIIGGGFKTSAELGITSHSVPNLKDKNYQDARNRVEAKTLGYDEKTTKPDERPIYGYLGSSNLDGNSHKGLSNYGSIAVQLKSDIKARTSFTGADSFKSGIASEVNHPSAASLVSLTRHGYDRDQLPAHYPSFMRGDQNDKSMLQHAATAKNVDDLTPRLAPTGDAYMEAQVHGRVKPADIAAIHFEPSGVSDRPSADVAKFAKANNVELYVSGKKLSSQEVDHIITPPTKHALHNLNDALDKGDLQGVFTHVDTIATHAASVKMNPGERDKYLKAMYQIAGYDNKPTVGSGADVTKAWQDGGTLIVRGDRPDPTDRTKYLKQFQTGDFHVGSGIYGNGTYVGHAGTIVNGKFLGHTPATAKADAKRAFDDVAKHNYISAKTVNSRMALTKEANIGIQSDIEKQRKAALKKLQALQKTEESQIQSAGQNFSAADHQKYNAAKSKALLDNDAAFGATKPKLTGKQQTSLGDEELHSYSVPGANKGSKLDFKIKSEEDLLSSMMGRAKKDWHFQDEDGGWQKVKTKKEALDKGQKAAIARKSTEDALKAAGLTHAPGQTSQVTQQKLKALGDKINAVKHIMGLNLGDTDGISYFAMIKGYDAVALNQSYEKKTFMTLLNRSKVVIQKDELDYAKAKQTGAL